MSEPYVASPAVSEHLGVPEATLADWRYRGEGPPFFKVGQRIRYRLSEVDAWAESRRVTAHAQGAPAGAPRATSAPSFRTTKNGVSSAQSTA